MLKIIREKILKIKNYPIETILIISFLVFSFWLMFSTFSYENGNMLIASKAWSDFASSIPLIRSFSFGFNFPPEYPLFPGEPIRYHFLFYALVGMLEKIGVRIDYALNIFSSLGFAGLLVMLYVFSKNLFKNKAVGILSVIFFLFNGSLSFIEFLKTHPLSTSILSEIISNNTFPSFGPYDGKIVSAFWNLNIYTNQRHLAPSFFLSLVIIYVLLRPVIRKVKIGYMTGFLLGVVLGISFFFHLAVFLMTFVVIAFLGILFKKIRIIAGIILIIAGIIALPQYLYLQSGQPMAFKPAISVGYLVQNNLTIKSFLEYWFFNLGLHSFLIPLGFLLAQKNIKKIFIAFLLIFIIGTTIQFSPEIAGNHKFFNYFMIIGAMLSALSLVKIWKMKNFLKPVAVILFFFLIFSGIIDFFPIYNDHKIALADYPINRNIQWIKENTPKDSVFLNTQYLYDPASLAGRKIFLGWPYFPWSAGYDTEKRGNLLKQLLASINFVDSCRTLKENGIDFIEIDVSLNDPDNPPVSGLYEQEFLSVYKNPEGNYSIYDIEKSCK